MDSGWHFRNCRYYQRLAFRYIIPDEYDGDIGDYASHLSFAPTPAFGSRPLIYLADHGT